MSINDVSIKLVLGQALKKYWYKFMSPTTTTLNVFNELSSFISQKYSNNLPNSLLIAQAFTLKYPDHGRNYSLSDVNRMIEDGIEQGLLKQLLQRILG